MLECRWDVEMTSINWSYPSQILTVVTLKIIYWLSLGHLSNEEFSVWNENQNDEVFILCFLSLHTFPGDLLCILTS